MGRVSQFGERLSHAIEAQGWLDRPSYKLEHGLALTLNLFGDAGQRLRNALHGTWLGHPLHAALTDVPVGAWTAAAVFDVADLAGRGSRTEYAGAARGAIGVGLVGAGASALTGLTDWQYTHDNARRLGLAHALLNVGATGLLAMSWRARGRGAMARGRALGGTGYLLTLAGGYLGGTLVSRHRIGVDHSDNRLEPRTYTAVLQEQELPDGQPIEVEVAGSTVTLVRHDGRVHALSAHCPHLGGPLSGGWLYEGSLVCPWHGSRFDLATGQVRAGPATAPIACLDARVRDGRIEIRRQPPIPQAPPGSVVAREQRDADAGH
jgi:nitrite reductase/ring-hydroxylating ferredoxin subunit